LHRACGESRRLIGPSFDSSTRHGDGLRRITGKEPDGLSTAPARVAVRSLWPLNLLGVPRRPGHRPASPRFASSWPAHRPSAWAAPI